MAGFSSRLREKIESTRSNATTSITQSNHQHKNIRGLTRLGVVGASPSGGLLSGRNTGVLPGNSVPLPIQTSSLLNENGGEDTIISGIHQSAPNSDGSLGTGIVTAGVENITVLGGSKIVPGWGSSSESAGAPSGHLGCIKVRESLTKKIRKQEKRELVPHSSLGKNVPWALHQPSSSPRALSHLSLTRRRWGDEEDDDSEEEFPQIIAPQQEKVTTGKVETGQEEFTGCSHQGDENFSDKTNDLCKANNNSKLNGLNSSQKGLGNKGGKHCDENQPVDCQVSHTNDMYNIESLGIRPSTNSHIDRPPNSISRNSDSNSYRERGNSYGSGDRWGKRRSLFDRRCTDEINDSRWGITHRTHSHFNNNRETLDSKSRVSGVPHGLREREVKGFGRWRQQSCPTTRNQAVSAIKSRNGSGSPSMIRDGPPMVLLRSNDSHDTTQSKEAILEGSHQTDSSAADITQLGESNVTPPEDSPDHCSNLAPVASRVGDSEHDITSLRVRSPTNATLSASGSNDNEDRSELQGTAVSKQALHTASSSPSFDQKKIGNERVRKDMEMEQQQNVLRQVAERRAASASSVGSESKLVTGNDSEWERGRHLSIDENEIEGKDSLDKFTLKTSQQDIGGIGSCRVEGLFIDERSDCQSNLNSNSSVAHSKRGTMKPKSERRDRPNPCRIEGHNHDWKDCPHNPKSESFIRNNPCRIEGHEHDWNDCLDNPKSDNYVRSNRKGKAVNKSLPRRTIGNRKYGDIADDSYFDYNKAFLTNRSIEDGQKESVEEVIVAAGVTDALGMSEVKPMSEKPFVPAPPPAVSAWISGPPSAVRLRNDAIQQPTENRLPLKTFEACHLNLHETVKQESISPKRKHSTFSKVTEESISLYPGNNALFGESGTTTIYDSWNPPPVVLPNTSIDPWKPNPFAPTTITNSPLGKRFESIWSDTSSSPVTTEESASFKMKDDLVPPTLPFGGLTINGFGS